MDKRICVYEIGESDYASNGLGAISPTKCLVHWEDNNEYSAEIEHPIDSLGKYERLNACGRTVVIPVPEAPSMRLNRTGSTTSVAVYTIATRKSRLRLRSGPGTNYKCLGYYAKGSKVTLINQTTASWYEVTAPDGYQVTNLPQQVQLEPGDVVTVEAPAGEIKYKVLSIHRAS